MSLKAKIEAVIYASEEPVTLAQLTGLLGQEGQTELDTLAANQLTLPSEDSSEGEADKEPEIAELAEDALEAEPETAPAEPASGDALNAETSEAPEPSEKALAAAEKLRTRKLRDYFRSLLDELIADYASDARGLEIKEVASGFRFATKPEYHDAVRGFVKSLKPPLKLTLQALETLAVVAYKQPVTAPEISEIRGVESAGTLGSLLTRKLIQTAGRKQVIGRPMLYKTSKDFLLRFGLKDINELPSIEEFERMAGELNEAVQEEMQMEESQTEAAETDEMSPRVSEGSHETADSPPDIEEAPADKEDCAPLDELNAVPEPTHVHHETPEDLISDKSSHPEGHEREPGRQ